MQLLLVCNFNEYFQWRADACADHGRRIAYGTADGVYFQDLTNPKRNPVRVLGLADVAQIDVLEEFQLVIVLSGRFSLVYMR